MRAESLTPERRAEIARIAGTASAEKMTSAERKNRARKAGKASASARRKRTSKWPWGWKCETPEKELNLMHIFELDDDLADFLEEMAKKQGRKDAQAMLAKIVHDYRDKELKQKKARERPTDKYRS
jgi:hypothetical protein